MLKRALAVLLGALLLGQGAAVGQRVTLVFVGDMQLGRGVGRAIALKGADYPFAGTSMITRAADLAVGNLECALSREGRPLVKRYSFKASPACADGLARAGFDILSLANNHTMDCGRTGLLDTMAALKKRGLLAVGAGKDARAAEAPLIVERNGLRIAVLAWTAVRCEGMIHRPDAPGVAVLDAARAAAAVRAARQHTDLVICLLHWGLEYTRQPLETQRRIAHRLIDAGAALVVGHHPHTPQPVERYKRGLIAYSLGNFVFDTARERARRGIILKCTLSPRGLTEWQVVPVRIRAAQPRPETSRGRSPFVRPPTGGLADQARQRAAPTSGQR